LKLDKNLVLSFVLKDLKLEFYKLKTIRGTNIFFDNEKNFYASWDDLWHVLNHISSDKNYHWTQIKPEFIAKDYRRLILGYLNNHKAKISHESYGGHLEYWSNWENILFEDGSTIDFDISCLNNQLIKALTIDYNSLLKTTNLDEVLVPFCDISTVSDFQIINLSSGKKITVSLSDQFLEQDVLPGDLLKLYKL
tara:strand:- start:584 stop:1165 length:582 start_codon:yes stop_codon:yes gene_type:complete